MPVPMLVKSYHIFFLSKLCDLSNFEDEYQLEIVFMVPKRKLIENGLRPSALGPMHPNS